MIHDPSLMVTNADITLHGQQLALLIIGLSVFIFALSIFVFAIVTHLFFIRPLHRLQMQARTLVTDSTGIVLPEQENFTVLARSLSVLSESLESESQIMTEQMSNILMMSDALISTVNLEHLLGEVVTRLGQIMKAEHVSLLLYGREMPSPWAVAQWSQAKVSNASTSLSELYPSQKKGTVTVHADPNGDITMAITTKLAAVPPTSSGKGRAVRPPQSQSTQPTYGIRLPRIPRPALRDLDMMLARMVIQREPAKIAYGEDVAKIYQERHENWARMALDAGYRAVISVPLSLQNQIIGAFMIYMNEPYQMSSRDTFLLSTAANQAAMAVQNALLFAEVKEKNAALERANHLKSQFLANVTHELRTPLHGIISYGSMVVDGYVGALTKEQEEQIQFIVRSAENLHSLVNDMLDLSKIEADHLEVKPEPIELAPCLQDVMNQLKPMASAKDLFLTLDLAEGLPKAFADSHRLRQIMTNLVSNALKFTEKGGVTIRCTRVKNSDMLCIAVQDTGIGISPAALGYIFEAFRQADGSTTRRFGGTGLGLTIARKLVELQGGEVAVESAVGQGSTFLFTLPASQPVEMRP